MSRRLFIFFSLVFFCCSWSSVSLAQSSKPGNGERFKLPREATPELKSVPTAGQSERYQRFNLSQKGFSPYWDRPYMLVAYALFWLAFFIYLLILSRRLSSLEQEIDYLRRELDERGDDE